MSTVAVSFVQMISTKDKKYTLQGKKLLGRTTVKRANLTWKLQNQEPVLKDKSAAAGRHVSFAKKRQYNQAENTYTAIESYEDIIDRVAGFDEFDTRSATRKVREFLKLSAMSCGYNPNSHKRKSKYRNQSVKLSGNQVIMWRRLAHYDWTADQTIFQATPSPKPGKSSFLTSLYAFVRKQNKEKGKTMESEATTDEESSDRDMPAMIGSRVSLKLLTEAVNSSIRFDFLFTEQMIRQMCNFPLNQHENSWLWR